jgi:hypothetical protein
MEAVMVAVGVVQRAEVAVEGAFCVVDVVGVTSASGRRTSKQFAIFSSSRKKTTRSTGSRLSLPIRQNFPFVCIFESDANSHFHRFVLKVQDGGQLANPA